MGIEPSISAGVALSIEPSMLEGLAELRAQTRGDPRVVVAILDGAVDLAHPALTAGNFVQLSTLTTDRPTRHGTHVASVAVGQGWGIAPACRRVSIPVFQESAEGELQACSQLDLARVFNPSERLTQARHVHRFTVDVSDVIPVTVGPVRSWAVY